MALKFDRAIVAGAGAFAMTGSPATLSYDVPTAYVLTAGAGAFTLDGTAAALQYDRIISVDAGSFAFTGSPATLTKYHPPSRPRSHDVQWSAPRRLARAAAGPRRMRRLRR